MINFKLINSYTENLFFFVSNLSEFHFSCRKEYNQEWQKITGKLSEEEKKSLRDFSVIAKKYGFDSKNTYLGVPFFLSPEKQKMEAVEKILDEKEFRVIFKTLELFKPKFELIYRKKELDKWIKIQSKILESEKIQNIIKEISSLLGSDKYPKEINIHLLGFISPRALAAGGANLGKRDITLEMPVNRIEEWIGEWGVYVALHEISHIIFENSTAEKIIKNKIKNISINKIKNIKPERDLYNLMKEIALELCAPSGYICEKNSKKIKPLSEILITNLDKKIEEFEKYKKNKNTSYYNFVSYIVWQTYPLVSLYVNKGKKIDSIFIDYLFKLLKAGD